MAELKTTKNNASVAAFLETVKEEQKRKDCEIILKIMKQASKEQPKMWGTAIVGFGSYHYKSAKTKREGDWFITGFSPRKQNITLYIMPGIDYYEELVKKLGKCKTSVSCLYINRLSDIELPVLKELISTAYTTMKEISNKN